ncbi:MAG: hypothetical protein ACI836_001533 [Saprospiraceae bacterium]|jgi:hypothetical protein
MKSIVYFFFISIVLIGCTSIEEDFAIDVQDYRNITHITIATHLKVANLIVDQSQFEEMYENYDEYKEVEIDGLLNIYKNGVLLLENEAVEIEIKGKLSSYFKLKSLGIKFIDTYNNEDRYLIDTETLPFHSIDRIKAFRFRNSGNDFEKTMLKDVSYTKLAIDAGLDIDLTYAEQTIVFINGEFLGIMNLRTEANANGMSRLYNVDKDAITLAKINHHGTLEKKNGNFDKIDAFINAIDTSDFNYLIDEIDIDNFMDYMIFESLIGNSDWPKNNVRFFAIDDHPFRFVMFDLDLAAIKNLDAEPMDFINNSVKNPITDLFNVLYENQDFKNAYDVRFNTIKTSGIMDPIKFNEIVTTYKSNIEIIMPTHIEKYETPSSFTVWYLNLENLKDNFLKRMHHID